MLLLVLGFRDNPGDIVNRSDLSEITEDRFLSDEVFDRVFVTNPRIFGDKLPLEVDERFENGESLIEILLDLDIISEADIETRLDGSEELTDEAAARVF